MQIIVLGMHRSGTSAFTGLIHMMGAALGPHELVAQPALDNEKGFWERVDVSRLNEDVLDALGCTWFDLGQFDPARLIHPALDRFRVRVRQITSELDRHRPWVLKDPRLCLTLPLWLPWLDAPVCVIPYRSPLEIARSIQARDQLSISHSIALWELYTLNALRGSQGLPRLGVSYGRLVRDPITEIQYLYSRLTEFQVADLHLPDAEDIRQFVETRLYHQRVEVEDSEGLLNPEQLYLAASLRDGTALNWTEIPNFSKDASRLLKEFHQWREQQVKTKESEEKLIRHSDIEQLHTDMTSVLEWLKVTRGDLSLQQQKQTRLSREVGNYQMQAILHRTRITDLENTLGALTADQAKVSARLRSDLMKLEGWLVSMTEAVDVALASWRWRIGDILLSLVERILFRPQQPTAVERLIYLSREFSDWQQQGASGVKPLEAVHDRGGGTLLQNNQAMEARSNGEAGNNISLPEMLSGMMAPPCLFSVILLASSDWGFKLGRPHQIARHLGLMGHPVYYVYPDLAEGEGQAGYQILGSSSPNVWVTQFHSVGRATSIHDHCVADVIKDDLVAALQQLCKDKNLIAPAVLVYCSTWLRVAVEFGGGPLILDLSCESTRQEKGITADVENAVTLGWADKVVSALDWPDNRKNVPRAQVIIPDGVEVDLFKVAVGRIDPKQQGSQMRVGYIGRVMQWFDIKLLIASALAYPDWRFIVAGAIDEPLAEEILPPNVILLGDRASCEIPNLVASMDVCIVPVKKGQENDALTSPVIYEYLSAGKPVVTTARPCLDDLASLVSVAEAGEPFLIALRRAMAERGKGEGIHRRQSWASGQDWSQRARRMSEIIKLSLPRVSVILLTYNNVRLTQACLRSLELFTDYPNWELIVVDNASNDGTPEYLTVYASTHENVRLILNRENLGFARGNNLGLQLAEGDYVILLNNDTYVTRGWLYGLIRHLINDENLGLIGPVTNAIANEAKIDIGYSTMEEMASKARNYTNSHTRQLLPVKMVAFFCVGMRRQLLEKVGMMDEQFGLGYFEDDDYCNRVQGLYYKIAIAKDVFVHHEYSASFNLMDSDSKKLLFAHNRSLFEAKWGSWSPPVRPSPL